MSEDCIGRTGTSPCCPQITGRGVTSIQREEPRVEGLAPFIAHQRVSSGSHQGHAQSPLDLLYYCVTHGARGQEALTARDALWRCYKDAQNSGGQPSPMLSMCLDSPLNKAC